jgi:hypothetical protein
MSRQLFAVQVTSENTAHFGRARLAAAVLFFGFFTLFFTMAPESAAPTPEPATVAANAPAAEASR